MLVKATAVPIVIGAAPWARARPAIQYTMAGIMVRLARREDRIQRPVMAAFISAADRARDSSVKRWARAASRPIVLVSITPATDSDSSTSVVSPASRRCRPRAMLRRCWPSRSAKSRKIGITIRQTQASFQFMITRGDADGRGREHVLHGRARGVADDVVDAADVVGDARLQLAGAGAGEEPQRHPLQVRVDADPQVVHHPLPDQVGQPGGPDAEHRGERGGQQHAAGEPAHQRGAALGQGAVDDLAQQERRRDAGQRLRRGHRHQGGDPAAVRAEQAGDPAHRHAVGDLGLQLGLRAGRRRRDQRRHRSLTATAASTSARRSISWAATTSRSRSAGVSTQLDGPRQPGVARGHLLLRGPGARPR